MKIGLLLLCSCLMVGVMGGVVYADDGFSGDSSNVDDTVITSSSDTNESTSSTGEETSTGTSSGEGETTTENGVGYTVGVVVSNDDMFTGLDTFLDSYTTDVYAPEMSDETKSIIRKMLTSLVISVVTGDGSYTLDSFKDAFIQILIDYGISVTDDVTDAVTKYAVHYLEDDFEQEDDSTDEYLVWIGSSLGLMTTLFITSQQGGVHRA